MVHFSNKLVSADNIHRDCSIRLTIGLFINLVMVEPVFNAVHYGFHRGGGQGEELAIIGGATAIVALILTARVLWRGRSWQQVFAILLSLMPVVVLFEACRLWWKGY
ncbi:MAG TPA: hypothetical protein VGO67_09440 [Verrucomicrobiae bacterium]|jgi:hypothetical protein